MELHRKGEIMRTTICRGMVISLLLFGIVRAESAAFNLHDSTIGVSGSVHMGMGEIMRGMYHAMKSGQGEQPLSWPVTVTHAWFGQPDALINLGFRPHEKVQVRIGFAGNIFLNTFPASFKSGLSSNGGEGVLPQYMSWGIHQAQGSISIIEKESMSLDFSLGVMPYKYNPEVRNLGEFLFRSGTYPFFLINNFDFPLARLSGARLNLKYGNGPLKTGFDLFVLSERTTPPFYDISLALLASASWENIVDGGIGVDFARIVPVNGYLTTPDLAKYEKSPGDTGRYTFKGTKVMARVTVDPFGTFRSNKESLVSELCGENGGKIYSEIAIIGLKNYPASYARSTSTDPRDVMNQWGYTKISERMPWMVGFNFPFWKILDVCAIEVERYPAPYPNDYYEVFMGSGLPVPAWVHKHRRDSVEVTSLIKYSYDRPYDSVVYKVDKWYGRLYWSVYMKKKVAEHFSLIGQISKDHMRWDVNLGNKLNYDTEEIMAKPGEWSWRLGVLFEF
jgi:hypothetical protein